MMFHGAGGRHGVTEFNGKRDLPENEETISDSITNNSAVDGTRSEGVRKRSFSLFNKDMCSRFEQCKVDSSYKRATVKQKKSRKELLLINLKSEAPVLKRTKKHRVRLSETKKFGLRRTLSSAEGTVEKNKTKINDEGTFILYHVANLFLSTDYEKCLEVCSINFSFISNSKLFESNILRFKALALE